MHVRTGDPELAREINRALVLEYLRNHEMISRAEIARKLNLSKATVSSVVNELIESHLISETGEGSSTETGRRPPVMLTLNTSKKFVIGVDLETTNIVAALANLKGEIIIKIRIPTDRNHSVENVIAQVTELVNRVISQSGMNKSVIIGLGMAVAVTV